MTEKTDLNVSPYYDDFNEDKNFHKILYRSGRALQSRELIQSQTILQNQIERFGDHMFKEGSIVEGAQSGLDLEAYYVKVESDNPNDEGDASVETYRTALVGKYYRGQTTGVVGKVISTSAETTDDALTIFVKYARQGTDTKNSYTFSPLEELHEVTLGVDGTPAQVTANKNELSVKAKTDADNPNGLASIANISEGVIFIRGFFVKVPAQEVLLEKYNGKPSYRIGLTITESLISSTTDQSLLDNSQGTSNENSTGADRLKIALTLSKYALTTTDDTDFVEMIRVNKGIIELAVNKPMYGAIENTMARRTFDANGDFVVGQFTHSLREHLDDTTNRGFYTKSNGGLESRFVAQISPGKAYVKGWEIDKIGTSTISFDKARTSTSLTGANTPIRIGNYLKVKNVHSLPEFGNEGGTDALSPHKECELWDVVISDMGAKPSASSQIGFTRLRNIELDEGTETVAGTYDHSSRFNVYMFDIKLFTKLTGTTSGASFVPGTRVVGSASGATGIVATTVASGQASILVHDVVGKFNTDDAISCQGTTAAVIADVTAVKKYNIDRVRSITQTPNVGSGAREIFTADAYADQDNTLTGTVTITTGGALTGFGTKFQSELKLGDIIIDGAGGEQVINNIHASNQTAQTVATSSVGAMTNANCVRRRVRLFDQSQTAAIASWPRDWISKHTPDSVTVRRQATATVGSGSISITVEGGTFSSLSTDNFTMAVMKAPSTTAYNRNIGDVLDIDNFASASDITTSGSNQTLTIGGFHADDETAVIKVTYTATLSAPSNRTKSLSKARVLSVESARSANGFYGTAYDDAEISLGVADGFKIRGIFEGTGNTTPTPPNALFTPTSGTFIQYETVIGQSTGAHAVIISGASSQASTVYFYYISGKLANTELVVGQTSGAIAQVSVYSETSADITSRYFFDNGQRDGYYDLAKIILKSGAPKPNNKICIVFDYFRPSGAGNFFDVNSYASIDYRDIPVYSPSRVDLGGLEPDGTFELSDCVDFRPVVGQVIGTTTFGTNDVQTPATPVNLSDSTSGAVFSPMGYTTGRSFESSRTGITATSANATDFPVGSVVGDISFYVGRFDKVFLHKSGKFQVSQGTPALSPTKPQAVDDSIELFELFIPPYTLNLKNIRVRSQDHRRFTMGDISRINNRVTNLERITSLSLLEKDTQTKQILDGDGFDRFKSGFLVDNFRGHRVGDVNHPDYECAIDVKTGTMRPQSFSQFFDINFVEGGSSSYKKTGDILTLPYTEQTFVNADKASRTSNVNPYSVFSFQGTLKLIPGTDVWQDTTQLPEVRINREGNFDSIQSSVGNSLGTVWNSWQTTWVGEPKTVSSEVQSTSNGRWVGAPDQGGVWQAGEQITREFTETVETQTRTGVQTSVVEDFVETRGDRIVSVSLIPWIRARTVTLDGENLKPNTNHYFYFDNIDVNKFVRPYDATYSQDGGLTVTSGLKTDGQGRLRGYFDLPNSDTQRFATGMREMRATSSFYNLPNPASSCGEVYQAQGLLQASQTTVTSTRNGRVVFEQLGGTRDITSRGEQINIDEFDADAPPIPVDTTPPPVVTDPPPPSSPRSPDPIEDLWIPDRWEIGERRRGWRDPLAQSFMVDSQGGMFASSIDIYFATKDTTMPVSVEIRTMHNGYPANVVMPFSTVTKNPADVNTSTDGSAVTTFTFESPVMLEDETEYCFVVYTNSNEYECFVSRMGEKDLVTGQTIAEQPYAGSLFKSQNNSTWTAEQTDDLKFHFKRCLFDTTKTPLLRFTNNTLDAPLLQNNPIQTFAGQSYVKVYSYTHGMYHSSSAVKLSKLQGDSTGSVLTIGTATPASTPTNGTTTGIATTGGTGSGCLVDIVVADGVITSCLISKTGSGYLQADTLTIGAFGGTTGTVAVDSIGDTLGGIPITALNATFTGVGSLQHIGIDSFCVTPSLAAYDFISGYTAEKSTLGGGKLATSTRNYYFDTLHTMIPNIAQQGTKISTTVRTTPMYSPEGYISGTVYTQNLVSTGITLNDNSWMGKPCIVASSLNQDSNMGGTKSFELNLQMQSNNPNISPVVDIGGSGDKDANGDWITSIGCLGVANRLNNINSSSDVPSGTTYTPSTSPDGDNNAMTYITRKVSLKTPAQGLKVIADFFRPPTTDLKVMYKVLENDDETPFDDLGWQYFNTTGTPDVTIERDASNFKEYEFTADNLNEYSAFSIKIVGQGTNTSAVPLVAALRCIAIT